MFVRCEQRNKGVSSNSDDAFVLLQGDLHLHFRTYCKPSCRLCWSLSTSDMKWQREDTKLLLGPTFTIPQCGIEIFSSIVFLLYISKAQSDMRFLSFPSPVTITDYQLFFPSLSFCQPLIFWRKDLKIHSLWQELVLFHSETPCLTGRLTLFRIRKRFLSDFLLTRWLQTTTIAVSSFA